MHFTIPLLADRMAESFLADLNLSAMAEEVSLRYPAETRFRVAPCSPVSTRGGEPERLRPIAVAAA